MKHIHETWAFLEKLGILGTSVNNVYGKPEWVCRTCHKIILRMSSIGQNGPLRRNNVFAVARIMKHDQSKIK